MSRAAVAPSIIDDVGFLDQLDKLEAVAAPEIDVLSAYWDHALRTDAADESGLPVLAPEPAAVAPEPGSIRSLGADLTAGPVREGCSAGEDIGPDRRARLAGAGRFCPRSLCNSSRRCLPSSSTRSESPRR